MGVAGGSAPCSDVSFFYGVPDAERAKGGRGSVATTMEETHSTGVAGGSVPCLGGLPPELRCKIIRLAIRNNTLPDKRAKIQRLLADRWGQLLERSFVDDGIHLSPCESVGAVCRAFFKRTPVRAGERWALDGDGCLLDVVSVPGEFLLVLVESPVTRVILLFEARGDAWACKRPVLFPRNGSDDVDPLDALVTIEAAVNIFRADVFRRDLCRVSKLDHRAACDYALDRLADRDFDVFARDGVLAKCNALCPPSRPPLCDPRIVA